MKIFKTWKSKIPIFLIVPAACIAAATSFALVSFSEKGNKNGEPPKAESFGDNFFDYKIAQSTGNTLKNNILYPEGGKNLIEKTVFLDEKIFTDNKKILNIFKFNQSEKKPLWQYKFDLKKDKTYKNVISSFVKANEEVFNFINKQENKTILNENRFGIYLYINSYRREIYIELYELKSNSKLRNIAKKYIDEFGDDLKPPRGHDFISTIWSPMLFYEKNIFNHMWYHDEKSKMTTQDVKYTDKSIEVKNTTGKPFNITYKDTYQKDQLTLKLPKTLLDNKMIASAFPFIDIEKENIDFIYDFYVLGEHSGLVRPSGPERVFNPENIIRIVKSVPIGEIYKKTAPLDKGLSNKIENSLENQKLIKSKLTKEWIDYINQPFIKPALTILNSEIPQINHILSKFTGTLEALGRLKGQKTNDGKNVFDSLFNEETNKKIIESINSSKIIQPKLFFDITFSSSGSEEPTKKWSSQSSFLSPSNEMRDGNKPSAGKELYTLIVGFHIISEIIESRINELVKDNQINQDPYDDIDLDPIVDSLIRSLVANNIIDKNLKISDIINDLFGFLKLILDKTKQNLSFPLTSDYIKVIIPLLPIDPKPNEEVTNKIAKTLGDIFKDKNNLLHLLKLLDTPDTSQIIEIIKDIKNKIPELIKIIGNNAPKQKDILQKIGRALIDKKALSQIITTKPGSINIPSIIEGVIKGFKLSDFKKIIKNLLKIDLLNDSNDFGKVANILSAFIGVDNEETILQLLESGLRSLNLDETKYLVTKILNIKLLDSFIKSPGAKEILDEIKTIPNEVANILYYLSR